MQTKLNMSEKYQYKVVRTKQEIDGIGEMESYGVELISENEAVIVPDVSTDFDLVAILVILLNRNGVSPIHVRDVIEDFLGEY